MKTSDEPIKDDSADESSADDSQIIPEELQQEAIELVDKCKTMACVDYISSLISEKRSEMYKKENEKSSKGKKKSISEYSTAGMPR